MRKFLTAFVLFFITTGVFCADIVKTPSDDVKKWYSTGVFYELFVRSFKDTDGDKYGDFKGVLENIDYLEKLGITAIWFMPINDSAEHTNNYDPTDFMNVDPTYGTMDDFKNLLNELHKRNIKVILDLVVNHTSSKHPFFAEASENVNSKYRNWYIWSDSDPNQKNKKPVWHKSPTGWYLGKFVNTKPDLNYDNPEVVNYMKEVMRFWLDIGADGFRFDAVADIAEEDEKNFEVYREFRKVLEEDKYKDKDLFLIGETSGQPYYKYLGTGNDMFHAVFNFQYNKKILNYVKSGTPYGNNDLFLIEADIVKRYAKDIEKVKGAFYGTLLTNHDSFTCEDDKKLKRPFTLFEKNAEKTKLAGSLYLTLPGIPFVYYGEEFGMDTYTASKSDRWIRSCMQWDDSNNAGFTSATKPWNMLNENYKDYNIKNQDKDDNSILNHYRKIIKLRTENPALSLGSFETINIVSKNKTKIAVYAREYENNKFMVVHNFSDKKETVDLDFAGSSLENKDPTFKEVYGKSVKFNFKKNKLKFTNLEPLSTTIFTY